MKNFLKNKVTIASILILVISSVLYHNRSFYNFFYTKINPSISELVGKNILFGINRVVHSIDIVGKVKELSNSLDEDDFIDLQIEKKEVKFLKKLLKTRPVKKKWVDINLVFNDIKIPAKLKYHGSSDAQYNGAKYSYTVEIESGHENLSLFKRFKLIKGQEADPTSGAVVPPIHLASTFVLPAAVGPADYDYARTGSPTRHAFEAVMASLDGGARAIAFASGMAAIYSTFAALLKSGDHIVSSSSVFGASHSLFMNYFPKWNISTSYFKVDEVDQLESLILTNTKTGCKLNLSKRNGHEMELMLTEN